MDQQEMEEDEDRMEMGEWEVEVEMVRVVETEWERLERAEICNDARVSSGSAARMS